jgi:hypothetical protein
MTAVMSDASDIVYALRKMNLRKARTVLRSVPQLPDYVTRDLKNIPPGSPTDLSLRFRVEKIEDALQQLLSSSSTTTKSFNSTSTMTAPDPTADATVRLDSIPASSIVASKARDGISNKLQADASPDQPMCGLFLAYAR